MPNILEAPGTGVAKVSSSGKSLPKNIPLPQLIERLGTNPQTGLSAAQVTSKFAEFGPNEIPEKKKSALLGFLKKFWGLSAWMIEAIAILSLILGKRADFYVATGLLLLNAVIGFLQEWRAQNVVKMLQSKLQIQTRALRDSHWNDVSARELVPGDIVRLRMGDFVPADLRVVAGDIRVDQSSLTGESKEQSKSVGDDVYSGSIVRQGEFQGLVALTGAQTLYGKTVELLLSARPKLNMEEVVSKLVRWLFMIVGSVVLILIVVAIFRHTSMEEILPLSLVLLMGAVPVALPVMFTVSTALGARDLGKQGVLVTRLSATEDAATMQVVCIDKTGTLTLNQLVVTGLYPEEGVSQDDLLLCAALASNESNRDSIDAAVLDAARKKGLHLDKYRQISFVPFTPQSRRTEAAVEGPEGSIKVMKGALKTIGALAKLTPEKFAASETAADALAKKGYRALTVAKTIGDQTQILGTVALYDPPRPDSAKLIARLKELGVRVKMLTGDAAPVARQIASEVGLKSIVTMKDVGPAGNSDANALIECLKQNDGIAEVFPEDKYKVIKALQEAGSIVGMTGDGVNDSPALQAAEVGIAVHGATDAARGAASVVLTESGLSGIVDLVQNGRSVYQRILTWMVNKVSRTVLKTGFVGIAYLLTGHLLVSALGMIVLVFMTDFVKITLATDRVRPSAEPDTWNIRPLVIVAVGLGIIMVAESLALLWAGIEFLGIALGSEKLHTFSFLILLYMALFSIISIRERGAFWKSRPSATLALALFASGAIGCLIGEIGIGDLPALPIYTVMLAMSGACAFSLGLNDLVKRVLLRWTMP